MLGSEHFLDPKTLGLVILVTIIVYMFSKRRRLPPGPPSLPIVGSMPFIGSVNPINECLARLRKKYGDIFSVNIGGDRTIVFCTHELIKEAFHKKGDVFSARPLSGQRLEMGNKGIVWSDGDVWREQRRFTLHILRDFGMGKAGAEDSILLEAEKLVEHFDKTSGKATDVLKPFGVTVSNVICALVFSTRHDFDDPLCGIFIDSFTEQVSTPRSSQSDIIPLRFRKYIPFISKYGADGVILEGRKLIRNIIKGFVEQHKKTFNPNNIRDFIDAYLVEIQERENDAAGTHYFTDEQMVYVIQDLFGAGTETTSTTMRWAMLYMGLYPDIQKKVQNEIDEKFDRSTFLRMADRNKVPYTEAVLLEIQRMAVLAPFVAHRAVEDCEISGYSVKENELVAADFWAIHRDPRVWKDPTHFNPSNFLDDDGSVINRDNLAPFSIGRRQCPGEALAKMEIFIFFTALMKNYDVTFPLDKPKPSIDDAIVGAVRAPHRYEIIFTKR